MEFRNLKSPIPRDWALDFLPIGEGVGFGEVPLILPAIEKNITAKHIATLSSGPNTF